MSPKRNRDRDAFRDPCVGMDDDNISGGRAQKRVVIRGVWISDSVWTSQPLPTALIVQTIAALGERCDLCELPVQLYSATNGLNVQARLRPGWALTDAWRRICCKEGVSLCDL